MAVGRVTAAILFLAAFHLGLLSISVHAERNPYRILGVSKSAPEAKIKKAFRSLSRTLHPDRNRDDPKAAEKFSDITWAYELLTNERLRTAYDRGGEEAVKREEQGQPPGGRPGGGTFFFKGPDGRMFTSGPGGGFPFGGGGGFPFGGGGGGGGGPFNFQGGGRRPPPQAAETPLDWFSESNVELSSAANFDVTSLGPVWPDVIFVIRVADPVAERAAKEFIAAAEALDESLNFSAVDCRNAGPPSPLCRKLGHRFQTPFEVALVYASQNETPALKTRQALSINGISSETIQKFIYDHVPQVPTEVSTEAGLFALFEKANNPPAKSDKAKTVTGNTVTGKPLIVIITRADAPLRVRQWTNEQGERAVFALASRVGVLSKKLHEAAEAHRKRSDWVTLALLIADPSALRAEAIDVLNLDESDFVIDMTLNKWVGLKRRGTGIYAETQTAVKEADAKNVATVCGPQQGQWCVVFIGSQKHTRYTAFAAAVKKHKPIGAFFLLDPAKLPALATRFASAIEMDPVKISKTPTVVAYKPKRKKFIQASPSESIDQWIESLNDSGILYRAGKKMKQLPHMP